MTHQDLMYLIRKANNMGFNRTHIKNIILPQSATQKFPEDTMFIVEHESQMELTSSDKAPWE